jgi:hypothetical protein
VIISHAPKQPGGGVTTLMHVGDDSPALSQPGPNWLLWLGVGAAVYFLFLKGAR